LLHKIAHRDPALKSAAIFYGNNFVALYRTHPIPDNKIVPVKMAPFFQCQTGYLAAHFFIFYGALYGACVVCTGHKSLTTLVP